LRRKFGRDCCFQTQTPALAAKFERTGGGSIARGRRQTGKLMTAIRVSGLRKLFGAVPAVDDVSFEVESGTILTLLGPSGCGKTTTLRMIAGLERPDAGEVRVGDRVVTSAAGGIHLPPDKRRMGMVFQSYAIWPHMNVFENIAFPLRGQRLPAAEIRHKVLTMLQSLGLEGLHDRPAPLLSGGQQQRVALGRALIADPDVLLLDEPFSNLDARRRDEMRFELKEVQARVGVTTIFITHDQSEAMILSDRVVVMNAGRIVQEGTPQAIYQQPGTRFVMEFLGQVDQVRARVEQAADGSPRVRVPGLGEVEVPLDSSRAWQPDDEVVLMLRSAAVQVRGPDEAGGWRGRVLSRIYLGERTEYIVGVGDARIRAFGPTIDVHDEGALVRLDFPPDAIRAWPATRSAENIREA
jgi:ABC-type Fe3+/spermidine/putrescine transport system ATPase subunit